MPNTSRTGIFVLNLDRSADRMAWMTSQLAAFGMRYHRVAGIDGENADLDTAMRSLGVRIGKPKGRRLARAEIACYLTHLTAIRQAIAQDCSAALILEDDAQILDDIPSVLDDFARFRDKPYILRLEPWHKAYWQVPVAKFARVDAFYTPELPLLLHRLLSHSRGDGTCDRADGNICSLRYRNLFPPAIGADRSHMFAGRRGAVERTFRQPDPNRAESVEVLRAITVQTSPTTPAKTSREVDCFRPDFSCRLSDRQPIRGQEHRETAPTSRPHPMSAATPDPSRTGIFILNLDRSADRMAWMALNWPRSACEIAVEAL